MAYKESLVEVTGSCEKCTGIRCVFLETPDVSDALTQDLGNEIEVRFKPKSLDARWMTFKRNSEHHLTPVVVWKAVFDAKNGSSRDTTPFSDIPQKTALQN